MRHTCLHARMHTVFHGQSTHPLQIFIQRVILVLSADKNIDDFVNGLLLCLLLQPFESSLVSARKHAPVDALHAQGGGGEDKARVRFVCIRMCRKSRYMHAYVNILSVAVFILFLFSSSPAVILHAYAGVVWCTG